MNSSPKEKKITVKFFLNQALEPTTDERGMKLYPLYFQVTYNRKNMQAKSRYGLFYKHLKEVPAALTAFEEKVLTKIIRYEAKEKGEGYELKGLKGKYDLYSVSVYQALEAYLKPQLRMAVLKIGGELASVLDFTQARVSISLLHEAATLLFPQFDSSLPQKLRHDLQTYNIFHNLNKEPVLSYNFPTIIDWLDESYKAELMLLPALKDNPDGAKKVVRLIDDAVAEAIKALETTS
jgi:hypothetical protein